MLCLCAGVPAGWGRYHRDQHIQQHLHCSGRLWTGTHGMTSTDPDQSDLLMQSRHCRDKGQTHRLTSVNSLTCEESLHFSKQLSTFHPVLCPCCYLHLKLQHPLSRYSTDSLSSNTLTLLDQQKRHRSLFFKVFYNLFGSSFTTECQPAKSYQKKIIKII